MGVAGGDAGEASVEDAGVIAHEAEPDAGRVASLIPGEEAARRPQRKNRRLSWKLFTNIKLNSSRVRHI